MPERKRLGPHNFKKAKFPKAEIYIIKDRCKGCGYCIHFCPRNVLKESQEINARGVHPPEIIDVDKCIRCNFCSAICPDFAIFVVEKKNGRNKEVA
jgi:2-oxoglutarate ferredoxin oxidoreductase subunit delta